MGPCRPSGRAFVAGETLPSSSSAVIPFPWKASAGRVRNPLLAADADPDPETGNRNARCVVHSVDQRESHVVTDWITACKCILKPSPTCQRSGRYAALISRSNQSSWPWRTLGAAPIGTVGRSAASLRIGSSTALLASKFSSPRAATGNKREPVRQAASSQKPPRENRGSRLPALKKAPGTNAEPLRPTSPGQCCG